MQFSTKVNIPKSSFSILPGERMLFVGSCFADRMGQRFVADKFRAVVNPYGVMYNPASIMHTVRRWLNDIPQQSSPQYPQHPLTSTPSHPLTPSPPHLLTPTPPHPLIPDTAVLTLGTNHVYILNETGEIVDNCRKRPQRLFTERELSIEECEEYLAEAVEMLRKVNPAIRVVVTVSPIRYAKYGFHGSQLSKATLLLAADRLTKRYGEGVGEDANQHPEVVYFPAYEIVNDELRDYRFYREDMLHPTEQAVEYIWERFAETFFSVDTYKFLDEWRPIKAALEHRPFNPDGEEYKLFLQKTKEKAERLKDKYPWLQL